ncbi:MAG: Zn-ribbon domain-containing protein [Methanothrix sp.]|uniref:Zn-ribbon domain-containing protein n=1 Tax=Methanothrix sp. TaxID=90426 RepID=UPI0026003DB2|nr:Zn-ribbon domain-containing protein [Methanothrix sp.]MCQ8903242.1 Zn-ribbon domain-containing protein [Methanothrix sp.]
MCTRCKKVFDDGADILKGCPKCGGRMFEYIRERETLITEAMGVRRPPRRAAAIATAVRDINEIKEEMGGERGASENIKKPSAIQPSQKSPEDRPIESVRITEPGRYELNLPTLFSRDELVMALKEGTYLIDLNSAFRRSKK